ncbi:DNA-binding MarR family transcriptional regulator [Novosphingobium hassiacum]|uniref:DNA-binding MarR family transcriptional regulator n=1 Tax=Novosphingobium hassiacum TaxID=173676 RepID=A0A7W6EXZ8_9SPHN|nr:MarR family transcriptional regulator [Novosphingobium hassiacum]MBB3862893.1 DNA-binding MarR family transcriptional regulator [Novosphingobium hassiacum]
MSVFLEETAGLNVTPTQAGLIHLIDNFPQIDQASAAFMLGVDRSTGAMVIRSLEKAGYVVRTVGTDRRRRCLELSEAGKVLATALRKPAAQAGTRLMEPLTKNEQAQLLRLLRKLTGAFNESARVSAITDPSDVEKLF